NFIVLAISWACWHLLRLFSSLAKRGPQHDVNIRAFTPIYMSVHSRSYPNLYKDSVSLMTVSAKVSAVPGIDAASVVMASATNVENLARAGLGDFAVRPNDLVVAVSGTDEACAEALQKADELLSAKAGGDNEGAGAQQPITSIQMAVARD